MSWLKTKKKNHHFEVLSSLILCNNNEPFLHWIVTYNEKWIFYDNHWRPAQWLDQEDAPKHFPKPNLHPKKVMVTVWWSAAHLIHYSFLNPGKPVHLKSMLSRFMRCTKNCSACSWLAVVNRKGPKFLKNLLQKLNKLGLICHIQLTSHQPPLLQASWQLFAGKIVSTVSRRQKMLSKSWLNPQAWIFHYYYYYFFDYAGSSLMCGLFSSCREQGLLSSCNVGASHCGGFSFWSTGSRMRRLQ